MAATHTPTADKIRWHGANHLNGGVSRFGEYFIAADRSIVFKRISGGNEEIDPGNKSDHDIYWACVNHNKMLLGITA